MKKLIIATFALYSSFITQANELVVPDLELGHWVTVSDASDFIEQALASIPKESRAMARQMMEANLKNSSTTEQCITKSTLENFEEEIKNAFGDSNCALNIQESNKKGFALTMNCQGAAIQINTVFINSKLSESSITSKVEGMPATTIKAVSKWKSKACLT